MKKILLVLSLVVFLSVNCFGVETIRFGAFPIPLMIVDKDNGVFVELTNTIAKRAGLDIDIVIKPPKRVVKLRG